MFSLSERNNENTNAQILGFGFTDPPSLRPDSVDPLRFIENCTHSRCMKPQIKQEFDLEDDALAFINGQLGTNWIWEQIHDNLYVMESIGRPLSDIQRTCLSIA